MAEPSAQSRRSLSRVTELFGGALRIAWRAGRRELIAITVLQAAGGLAIGGQILAAQAVLVEIVKVDRVGRADIGALMPGLAALVILMTVMTIAALANSTQTVVLGELVARYADSQILDVACAVELEAFERPAFHDRLERAKENAATEPLAAVRALSSAMSCLFGALGAAVALLAVEPLLLPLMAVGVVPLWLSSSRNSRTWHAFKRSMTSHDRVRQYFYDVLTDKNLAKEVRAYRMAQYLRGRRDEYVNERLRLLRQMMRTRLHRSIVAALVVSAGAGGSVLALAWLLVDGRTSLARAGAAIWGLIYLGQRSRLLVIQVALLYESSLFIEEFTSFHDVLDEYGERTELATSRGLGHLRTEGLTYTYPGMSRPAVDGVTLDVRAGEIVAVVGENGSGKTTLAKLIGGLYRPSGGRVLWDGQDVAAWSAEQVRHNSTVMFQDYGRFHVSARENIGLGRTERADDLAAIERAAERAGAAPDIERLPAGYETPLSRLWEGGADLSGGQWQRIALARALFRDAPLLILDEPSASLDARSELRLFEGIKDLAEGRAVLLISHRFATVRLADRIYVLKEGGVVEQGTHDELMADDALYASMFTLQASAFGLSR